MKPNSNTIRLLFAFTALSVSAPFVSAGPGPQYWTTLRDQAQFKQLKTGDKVAFVCNECKTVSAMTIKSPEDAMELCKDGGTVSCPACQAVTKIVVKRQRNDPPTKTVVTYVNARGEECAFVTTMADANSR